MSLQQKIQELEAWKADALAALALWHTLGDALLPFVPVTLGEMLPVVLAERIPAKMQELEARLAALSTPQNEDQKGDTRVDDSQYPQPLATASTVTPDATKCPTCDSPHPHLHPAVQFEGEVETCADAFHLRETPQNLPQYRDLVRAKAALSTPPQDEKEKP